MTVLILILGALSIGLTIGLLGSGGSLLTVPVLVYAVGHNAKISIAESMAIVGVVGIVSAIPYARSKQIDWKSVAYFGTPAMVGTFVGAWLGGFSSDAVQLGVFGSVVILAAVFMIRKAFFGKSNFVVHDSSYDASQKFSNLEKTKIVIEGLVVGVLTGFVGVGGGFLIVPALIMFGKLPVRLAIGTSVVITVLKSWVGFAKYQHYLVEHAMTVDWGTIGIFSCLGIIGGLAGQRMNSRLNQVTLQKVFAVFLVLIGGFILVREGGNALNLKAGPSTAGSVQDLDVNPVAHEFSAEPSK